MALKAVPKATTTLRDFLLEFHYCYYLSPHTNILDTYDVAFETRDHYYFAQEVAPFGDLAQVSATVIMKKKVSINYDWPVKNCALIYLPR